MPSCSRISLKAMAKVLEFGPLSLFGQASKTLVLGRRGSNDYGELVTVAIIPGIKSIYQQAEGKAMMSREGGRFGKLSSRLAP
jgi:hypothetical protein